MIIISTNKSSVLNHVTDHNLSRAHMQHQKHDTKYDAITTKMHELF